jgi:NAD(P)-dependent dehydrogenase (short-subunit alcohol dehydrogenase family)
MAAMTTSKPIALITGASRGIGAEIANALIKEGYRVFGTSRDGKPTSAATCEMLTLDVREDASANACVEQVLAQGGRLDVLINNAGYDLYGALEETPVSDFIDQVDVNLFGAMRMTKAAIPHLRAQQAGRIVMIGSLGGEIGLPFNTAYAASKFALHGMTESLRLELQPFGIHVSIVSPGAVATDSLDQSIREIAVEGSAYSTRRTAMTAQMRKDGHASHVKPGDVARAVMRCVSAKNPALRYPVGNQAIWVSRMKAFMPQRIFEQIIGRQFP